MSASPAVVVVAAAAVDVVDIGPHASRVFIETRSSRLSTLSHVNILDSRQWTGCQREGGISQSGPGSLIQLSTLAPTRREEVADVV